MKPLLLLFFIVLSIKVQAQLNPNFDISINTTAETCPSNGSITINTVNTTAGSSLIFELYESMSNPVPIIVTNDHFISGLTAGNYYIKAIEQLGTTTQEKTTNCNIDNQLLPFDFSRVIINNIGENHCDLTAVLQITTLPNTAEISTYQIISGPVTSEVQTSNIFNNLPAGQYEFKTVDICGRVSMNSFNLGEVEPANFSFLDYDYQSANSPMIPFCDSIYIKEFFNADNNFPITLIHEVNDPQGNLIFTRQNVVNSGSSWEILIPYFNETYSYQLTAIDACGNTFQTDVRNIDLSMQGIKEYIVEECEHRNFAINCNYFYESFTINFDEVPEGFIPENHNSNLPGPFTDFVPFGDADNLVPPGDYYLTITDNCGRSTMLHLFINNPENFNYNLEAEFLNFQCTEVESRLFVSNHDLISLEVVIAPTTYPYSLPHSLTDELINGEWTGFLPYGTYKFVGEDDCELNRVKTFNLNNELITTSHIIPGCGPLQGGVRLLANKNLQNAEIIDGPTSFSPNYPIEISDYIQDTELAINNLPIGEYIISLEDDCGMTGIDTLTIFGFDINEISYEIIKHCGAFDISLGLENDVLGLNSYRVFLQKWNPENDSWGHPETGEVGEGLLLNNASVNYNNNFTGFLRLLVRYNSIADEMCEEVLHEFIFENAPMINNIYSCNGTTNSDVIIDAVGYEPLTYRIIEKNGEPFVIQNGTSEIFTNLEEAVYLLQVEDACGNSSIQTFNINELVLPEIEVSTVCENGTVTLSVFQANYFNYSWVNLNSPSEVLSTSNILEIENFQTDNEGLYQVTITSNISDNCTDISIDTTLTIENYSPIFESLPIIICENSETFILPNISDNGIEGYWIPETVNTQFTQNYTFIPNNENCNIPFEQTITVVPPPNFTLPEFLSGCVGDSITLDAGDQFVSYLWSTGANTSSIIITEGGEYTVEVTDSAGCEVLASTFVYFDDVDLSLISYEWIMQNLHIINNNEGNFEYSLDEINWQTETIFNGPFMEDFRVYIREIDSNCVYSIPIEIPDGPTDPNEPSYFTNTFTPNGDGYNDVWNLPNIEEFAGSELKIYNRYGKLIHQITIQSNPVWDGKYLNEPVHSSTYWYKIITPSGELKQGYILVKNRYKKDYHF